METLKALAARRSIRSYRPEQIGDAELDTVLRAANLAPVGLAMFRNYRLTVVRDKKFMERVERATERAFDHDPMMCGCFYGAPTLIVVSAIRNPNPEMPGLEIASAACIADTMLIAATDAGLASIYLCAFVEGLNAEPDLTKELGLPEGFSPVAGILLGYTDEIREERIPQATLEVNRI
jgi:nitroreductase